MGFLDKINDSRWDTNEYTLSSLPIASERTVIDVLGVRICCWRGGDFMPSTIPRSRCQPSTPRTLVIRASLHPRVWLLIK